MHRKKIVVKIICIVVPVLLIVGVLSFFKWNRFYNKSNLINKYLVDNTKEVYVLGTIGKKHFDKVKNYSMEDLLSAIENIDPDLVLIDAREDHFKDNGIIDGDIDMCVTYSYCFEHDIPIEMVDWWVIDNIYPVTSTTNLRDDNIFIKINRRLKSVEPNSRTLVVCNSSHVYNQLSRFNVSGYRHQKIQDKKKYFVSKHEEFDFPLLASKIWKDRLYFYAYTFPKLLEDNEFLDDKVKNKFLNADHDSFYRKGIKYCTYLNNDILYK